MKNLMKKLSVVLMLAMVISLLPIGSVASAAKKKTIKRTMYVGDTLPLEIRTTFLKKIKPKKVKWSTSNKKVATVSKKGVVKAKKKGKATITAKYKKQKFLCKINVKNRKNNVVVQTPAPTPLPTATPIPNNELAQNVVVNIEKLESGEVLYTVVNNNAVNVPSVSVSIMYCDAIGTPVESKEQSFKDLELSGGKAYYVDSISSDKLAKIDFTKTKVSVNVSSSNSYRTYVTDKVTITGQPGEDNKLFLTYTNTHDKDVFIEGVIFYKDATGKVLAADYVFTSLTAGATDFKDYSVYYKETVEGSHKAYLDKVPYVTADWVYRAHCY